MNDYKTIVSMAAIIAFLYRNSSCEFTADEIALHCIGIHPDIDQDDIQQALQFVAESGSSAIKMIKSDDNKSYIAFKAA